MRKHLRGVARLLRMALIAGTCGGLGGCAWNALDNAPASPSMPWKPDEATGSIAPAGFGVPPDDAVTALQPTPGISRDRVYGLAELIDVAQRHNPATRIAWEAARQAALAAGMVEATYLPIITANVIAGSQEVTTPLPVPIDGDDDFTTRVEGVSPQIALQWLVFDFGGRRALHKAAEHNSTASNILFNGVHQQVIYDVTSAYYLYGAARTRVAIAQKNLANSKQIEAAAVARNNEGIGNTVAVAQARQAVAQANFGLVNAQGEEKTAYQALLAAMGVSPVTKMDVASSGDRPLPPVVDTVTEGIVREALARRPDVLASYAAMQGTEAGIDAAKAAFLPKVYLAAVAAGGKSNLSAGGLPTIGQSASTSGVLVGMSVPIFNGGLRVAELRNAESVAAAGRATYRKTKDDAAREIVVSAETLRSALSSYQAATALVSAAAVTYDAAFESYKAGVGNVTEATAADSGLLAARQAQADAHAAALVAAANLAFMLGDMTSSEVATGLLRR
jgi:outer membrane protein TolC